MSDNILPANTDTCLVEFDKKEYAIVGDLFFAKTLEEVPPWFQNLIKDTVVSTNGSTYDTLTQYNQNLLAALQGIEISKNTYEQYINKRITDQEAYISVLTTLNASINDNDASIRQLLLTYATEDFAVASAAQLLTASLNGGAIGARISSAESAMATQYGAMAQYVRGLEAEYNDSIQDLYGKAAAFEATTAYVGRASDGESVSSISGRAAKLENYLTDSTTGELYGGVTQNLGSYTEVTAKRLADNTVEQSLIDAYSKYSTITFGGKTYVNGFGLYANYNGTTGGSSTFWVAADQFKIYDPSTLLPSDYTTAVLHTSAEGEVIEVVTGINPSKTINVPFQVSGGTVYIGWDNINGTNRPADGATRNVNRGTWDSGISYAVGDIVQYNGSSYTNKLATNSINPTNTSYWTLLASQGLPGADGSAGVSARAVSLVAANGGVFTYNSAGLVPSPTSTVVTATAVNTAGTVYYEFFVNDVSVQNTTSNTRTVTAPSSLSNSKIEVQIREGASTGSVLARDQLTIVGIKPGVSAFTVVLTNEAHTLPVNEGVVTYTGSGTTIKVYEGSTALTYNTVGNGTFSVTAVGSGISVGTNTNGVFSDHSNMTTNNATVTYTITVRSSTGVVSTLTKIQSLAKSLQGITGATGSRGASTANKTVTTALGSYTAYDSDFATVTGFSDRVKGDTLIVTSSHSTDGGTKTWIRDATGSTSWTNYAWAVNGNALITGSLTASRIKAGHIGAVYTNTSPPNTLVTALATVFTEPATNTGTKVVDLEYTNLSDVPVTVLVSALGRTGFQSTTGQNVGSTTFYIVQDNVKKYYHGWTPAWQDSKAGAVACTVAANTTSILKVEMWKSNDAAHTTYNLFADINLSLIGVAS